VHAVTRGRQLALVALFEVLVMSLWFSASAVVPELRDRWQLSSGDETWLTTSVQLGFVAGALASAMLNLPDRISVRRLMALSALAGALVNAALPLFADGLAMAVPLRFATGVALAGVYPPGIKLIASWFRRGRGLAVGVMVGALALGSGSPHLINAAPSLSWQRVLWISSGLAVAGAVLIWSAARDGPDMAPAAPFQPRYVVRMLRDRRQRLVSFGYFGHMWELYAMYTWVPAYAAASYAAWRAGESGRGEVELTAFAAIGVAGAIGCVAAGAVADRVGRAPTTIVAMAVSGACCLLSAVVYAQQPAIVLALLLVWGVTIVADSAQFSTALTEVADRDYVGTAVTAQTAIGFLITVASIRLVPVLADQLGWRWAFVVLAAGPALGIPAMAAFARERAALPPTEEPVRPSW
jgi:MFS family permease